MIQLRNNTFILYPTKKKKKNEIAFKSEKHSPDKYNNYINKLLLYFGRGI